jgi:integrase/recombinase XerD
MTPLRAKYIRDLVIHGRSKHTQEAYTRYVCDLARYYRRSPELISYGEVTGWLYYLITERQLSASSVNIGVSAVRFLYAVTLGRETLDLMASVSDLKRATRRAEVYARSEVEAILIAPRQPRDRVLLMTVYGCGLRISEATQLKTSDIDRARMQLPRALQVAQCSACEDDRDVLLLPNQQNHPVGMRPLIVDDVQEMLLALARH